MQIPLNIKCFPSWYCLIDPLLVNWFQTQLQAEFSWAAIGSKEYFAKTEMMTGANFINFESDREVGRVSKHCAVVQSGSGL